MGLRTTQDEFCNILVIGIGGTGYRSAIAACDEGKDVMYPISCHHGL